MRAESGFKLWVVSDGKPGHVNQSLGLAEALARKTGASVEVFPAGSLWRALSGARPRRTARERPFVVIGAGHATHLTLLVLGRVTRAPTVVLMTPSLPRRLFDFCVPPAHDRVAADARTFVSVGALNRIVRPSRPDPDRASRGLFLIGGESRHFAWDSEAVITQIRSVAARTPQIGWTLTTSRRTPADFTRRLPTLPNLAVVAHTTTSPDWLPAELVRTGTVWASPDSMSMVTEALTAGADVGVFDLPVNPKSRVGWAIADLADAGRITRFIRWCAHGTLHPNTTPLDEAGRCADWLLTCLSNR